MTQFGQFLRIYTIMTSLLGTSAMAQTTLTQITDLVNNPDGTPFNGTLSLTWTGSTGATASGASPYSTSVKIYNGVLSLAVAPSTAAYPPAFYLAVYTSSDGRASWVETWQVGPSSSALTLSQVRANVSSTTSTAGGATLAIGQVTGLSSYLNAISNSLSTMTSTVGGFNATVGSLSNTVTNLQAMVNNLATNSTSGSSATFVDGETPGGTIDGNNAVFTLANTPVPTSSLLLTRNGILLQAGTDYSLAGSTITFMSAAKPQSGDAMLASYRLGARGSSNFVDAAVPSGAINGTNLVFGLTATPVAGSLKLYKNGFLLVNSVDYTLNGSTITFTNAVSTPTIGDSLIAYYRTGN